MKYLKLFEELDNHKELDPIFDPWNPANIDLSRIDMETYTRLVDLGIAEPIPFNERIRAKFAEHGLELTEDETDGVNAEYWSSWPDPRNLSLFVEVKKDELVASITWDNRDGEWVIDAEMTRTKTFNKLDDALYYIEKLAYGYDDED